MSRILRICNAVFWVLVWIGIIIWTESYGQWIPMVAEAFVPLMLWLMLHHALRPGGPEN